MSFDELQASIDTVEHGIHFKNFASTAVISPNEIESICSYTRSRCRISGKDDIPSMQSFSTQWSTKTARASNTTRVRCEKKATSNVFRTFVKILIRLLERKDEGRFKAAKEIIRDSEEQQQNRNGDTENSLERICTPLRNVAGKRFWTEAREQLSRAILYSRSRKITTSKDETTETDHSIFFDEEKHEHNDKVVGLPLIVTHPPFSKQVSAVNRIDMSGASRAKTKEMRTRKKRLWMIICIMMQHLQKTNEPLYLKAHALVNECVQRHRKPQRSEQHRSLSHCIQFCLKNEIGIEYWRHAENRLAKYLLKRHQAMQDPKRQNTRIANKRLPVPVADQIKTSPPKRQRMDDEWLSTIKS